MEIKAHPVIPPPGWAEIAELAAEKNIKEQVALDELLRSRNLVIEAEANDPFRFGWEPTIWKVCDALLGFECWDHSFINRLARLGMDWDVWSEKIRQLMGFMFPVSHLLIMGGNRTSKSEYSAKRAQQIATHRENASIAAFHMSEKRSVRDQQKLFWKYMPTEWRKQTASEDTYIKYKRHTGFAEGSYINPMGSEVRFLNYNQDQDSMVEGLEPDLLAPDELASSDLLEALKYRLATRKGRLITTFTPVNGYTAAVAMFCDQAVVARECVGYLLPNDGGDVDMPRALGLSPDEYEELATAQREKKVPKVPYSRPEDCVKWVTEPEKAKPTQPAGRHFEIVPRVLRCADPKSAVVYFHPSDNPYGNCREIYDSAKLKGRANTRMRVYGVAERMMANVFIRFNPKVHAIKAQDIPKEGTNYFFMDPAGDRNFFMTWIRRTKDAAYVVREWPGTYDIPGVGVPEPWAIPSGRKNGINDGGRGEGQDSFGFGLSRYKFETARLEGWTDFKKWKLANPLAIWPGEEELEGWAEWHGADEVIEQRYVDSRAASSPRVENDRPVTLYEDLNDLGLDFALAPGADVDDGITRIISALDYEQGKDLSYFNRPKLFFCEDCKNTIFAVATWRNAEGDKGPTKDPIDNLRYFYTAECDYVAAGRGRQWRTQRAPREEAPTRRPACMDNERPTRRAMFRRG